MQEERSIDDRLTDLDKALNDISNDTLEVVKILKKKEKRETAKEELGAKVVQQINLNDSVLKVKEYDSSFVGDIKLATDIYHAQKLGMKLRQLEVILRGGTVAFESGEFLDASGQIRMGRMSLNPMELFRGVVRKMNDETFFRPTLTGNGVVTFNSSFKFITLFPVQQNARIVLEKGIYLASIGDFQFKTTKNLNASYMLFSDKSVLQTDVRGKGVLVLDLPVKFEELVAHDVTEEKPYIVNGDYVLMWSGNLRRTVKPAGSLFGSLASSTGLVEEYSGEGKVWTAPTLGYYLQLANNLEGSDNIEERDELLDSDRGKTELTWLQKLLVRK